METSRITATTTRRLRKLVSGVVAPFADGVFGLMLIFGPEVAEVISAFDRSRLACRRVVDTMSSLGRAVR